MSLEIKTCIIGSERKNRVFHSATFPIPQSQLPKYEAKANLDSESVAIFSLCSHLISRKRLGPVIRAYQGKTKRKTSICASIAHFASYDFLLVLRCSPIKFHLFELTTGLRHVFLTVGCRTNAPGWVVKR